MPRVLAVIIERAAISDAEEILSLQKLDYQSEAKIHRSFDIPSLTQTLKKLESEFDSKIVLKAVSNGKIIGSVRAFQKGETCYIGRLIVHPDFQNRGIGTTLMREIEKLFSRAKRFELFTGHKSTFNIHFYQKLGYKIFKTEKTSGKLTMMYLEKSAQQ